MTREAQQSLAADLEAAYMESDDALAPVLLRAMRLVRCADRVIDLCAAAEHQATRWEHPFPVPEWVGKVRAALADGAA